MSWGSETERDSDSELAFFFINCDNGVMGLGSKHEGFSVVLTLERILQFPVFS